MAGSIEDLSDYKLELEDNEVKCECCGKVIDEWWEIGNIILCESCIIENSKNKEFVKEAINNMKTFEKDLIIMMIDNLCEG